GSVESRNTPFNLDFVMLKYDGVNIGDMPKDNMWIPVPVYPDVGGDTRNQTSLASITMVVSPGALSCVTDPGHVILITGIDNQAATGDDIRSLRYTDND